jgi:uridylate kinase
VYSADPRKSPNAQKFRKLSYDDAIKLSINASIGAGPNVFMDITSLNIAKRSSIEIHVVNGLDLNVYSKILSGTEHDGTVIGSFAAGEKTS